METGGVAVAAIAGGVLGALAPLVAARIGAARYAEGTPGHDPEDADLAPLRSPDGLTVRIASAAVGAVAFAALAAQYDSGQIVAVLAGLTTVLLVACLVDLRYLRLPNLLTYGGALAVLAAIVVVSYQLDSDVAGQLIRGAVVGAVAYAGFLFVVAELFRVVRGKTGMGLGDVKLALSLGATLGWIGWATSSDDIGSVQYVIYAALIGNVLGAIGGLVLTRFRPDRHFPFGPFLALGWLITIALQP